MANNEPHERLDTAKPYLAEVLEELHADLEINAVYKVLKHAVEVRSESPDEQLHRAYKEMADFINKKKGLGMNALTAEDLCPPDVEARKQHISDTSKLSGATVHDIIRFVIKGE